MSLRSRPRSRPFAVDPHWPGCAPSPRSRMSSSISWARQRTTFNEALVRTMPVARSTTGRVVEGSIPRLFFWRRTWAMLIKEFIQLRRDRVTFAMIVMIPLMQLMLFGYAINTNPRHLPTAVLLQEQTDVGRSIIRALENTKYFNVTHEVKDEKEFDHLLASGSVLFAIEIPANFERAVRRGERPALLVAADATDPVAAGSALAALSQLITTALQWDHGIPESGAAPFEIRTHARYNPAANTSLNIVPG